MWMKDFTHMSCQRIRTFETIFSSSKTMPAYLQYGKEHVCKLAMSNPLTSLPGLRSTTPGIIWPGGYIIVFLPKAAKFPDWNTIDNAFHKGWGWYNQRLLLSMRKRLIECIHKGGGHARHELLHTTLYHNMFMSAVSLSKDVYFGWPSFL